MKIILLRKWMGTPKGATLDIQEHVARRLIEQKTAKLAPAQGAKAIAEAPHNKMASSPVKAKAASAPA